MSTFNRITVSARLLRAAMTFAAKNDVRYYLNGVLVEPSPDGQGVRLVATDGHRLAVLFDADGSADAPAIIERHKLPTLPRKGSETLATFDGERATYPGGTSLPVSYVAGRFPDWQAVVPDVAQLTGAPGAFNTEYLADLEAVPAGYESKNGAAIHCRDPESSALVTFGNLPAFVVLMPLRNGDTAPALPDFMRAGEPQRLAIALRARAVELESARMRVHALADVHAGDWRHADARAALLKSGRRWLDMVRRCKRAGLATVSALPFPADRSAWPQAGTVAAAVYPFAVDAFDRFDVASPAALVPDALLSPDGRYACDACDGLTDRAALVADVAGYYCPDCAGTAPAPVAGYESPAVELEPAPPVPAIETAPPVPAPLAVIRILHGEGRTSGVEWPAGEAREFRGPAAWSAAHAALAALCHDAPQTGGYEKCDVSIEWANGDVYAYRFDAQHPATPGGQGDTPDLARHIVDHLHFLEGAARPLHMTPADYRGFLASSHAQDTAAELRAQLQRCAFPLDLTPPAPADELPLPVPGRRCWYRGWGPGSEGSGAGIITELDAGNPPADASPATLARHVRFTVVTLRDLKRHTFSLHHMCDTRPAIILGDTMATDLETSTAQRQSLDAIAAKETAAAIAEVQFNAEVASLRAAHPQLLPASERNAVGHNLRAMLKAAGIRASVRKERGSMVSSYRIDLPATATDEQLKTASAIGDKFEAGHFDGMTDCYEYSRRPWTEAFGAVRYVFTQREWAPATATPDGDGSGASASESAPPVQTIEPAPPVPATMASAAGDDTGATVTNLADYRATQAAQREICGTQVPEPGQNSPTPATPRSRGRWDAAAGAWVPVQRAG